MHKDIKEENMSLLHIYADILDTCDNNTAKVFLIKRIYKILSKSMKARASADFPQTSYDLQVVNLVAYIREEKLAYAFLYASSLRDQNTTKDSLKEFTGTVGILGKLRAYFGF